MVLVTCCTARVTSLEVRILKPAPLDNLEISMSSIPPSMSVFFLPMLVVLVPFITSLIGLVIKDIGCASASDESDENVFIFESVSFGPYVLSFEIEDN